MMRGTRLLSMTKRAKFVCSRSTDSGDPLLSVLRKPLRASIALSRAMTAKSWRGLKQAINLKLPIWSDYSHDKDWFLEHGVFLTLASCPIHPFSPSQLDPFASLSAGLSRVTYLQMCSNANNECCPLRSALCCSVGERWERPQGQSDQRVFPPQWLEVLPLQFVEVLAPARVGATAAGTLRRTADGTLPGTAQRTLGGLAAGIRQAVLRTKTSRLQSDPLRWLKRRTLHCDTVL
jgi:hypothetical protein